MLLTFIKSLPSDSAELRHAKVKGAQSSIYTRTSVGRGMQATADRRYERLRLYEKSALYFSLSGRGLAIISRCGNGNAMGRLAEAMQGNKLRRSGPQAR